MNEELMQAFEVITRSVVNERFNGMPTPSNIEKIQESVNTQLFMAYGNHCYVVELKCPQPGIIKFAKFDTYDNNGKLLAREVMDAS